MNVLITNSCSGFLLERLNLNIDFLKIENTYIEVLIYRQKLISITIVSDFNGFDEQT